MINRVSSNGPFVFTGGVAKNPCMVELLSGKLDREIRIPADPQLAVPMVRRFWQLQQGSTKAVIDGWWLSCFLYPSYLTGWNLKYYLEFTQIYV